MYTHIGYIQIVFLCSERGLANQLFVECQPTIWKLYIIQKLVSDAFALSRNFKARSRTKVKRRFRYKNFAKSINGRAPHFECTTHFQI